MGAFAKLRGLWGNRPRSSVRSGNGWMNGSTPFDVMVDRESVSGFAALFRGVEVIKGQLLATPLLVFDGREEAPNSAAARCIRRTDPAHMETAISDMLWSGNGWLRIIRDGTGAPYSLDCVQAFRVSAEIDTGGNVVYRVDGNIVDPVDYVHLQCRNNFSPYVGDGLIQSNDESVANVAATLSIYRALQTNGSHAELFLTTEAQLNRQQMQTLREAYNEQTKGWAAGGVPILSNGLKPVVAKTLPSALDQDVIKSLEFSVAEAARMTGVPLHYLSVRDSSAYASAVESGREFYRTTIRPLQYRVERELSAKLGADIRYDAGEVTLGYGVDRADTLSKLMYSGLISANEARQTLGYSPIKHGDVMSMPANQLPINNWLDNGLRPVTATPATPAKELNKWLTEKGLTNA